MSKFYTLSLCFLYFFTTNLSAQVTVKTDRPSAAYNAGEQMNFLVSGGFGTATYVIKYDRENQAPNIAEGTIQVNGTAAIPFKLDHPGMVFCVVILNGQRVIAGAAFSPFQIQPYEDDPADFDQFWQGWKNKLAAVPINPVVTPLFPDPSPRTRDFRINLGHIDGRRVYGYLSIPNEPGNYPAIITHASFGGFANLCIPRPEIAINANVISLSIWMHNREPDQNDPSAYMPEVWDDRERIFYRYGVLGIIRAIDYIHTMPEFDGQNLGLSGVSEGGGLSILTAGVDNRVDIVAASIFALSEHTGYKYNRASGFPFFILRANNTWPPVANENAVTASKYYDAVRAAKRFKGPVYSATGYVDETVMPATNFGAFNQFQGSTVLVHKIEGPHLSPTEFGDGKFNFFRKHFNIPGNTGYFADAGADVFNANGSTSLNGRVELNGADRNDFSVEWEKVSGPGDVIFSNKFARKTDVNFTEQGEYVLRFRATDQSMLAASATYFSVLDHVIVSTSGGSNPCAGDVTPPTAICKDLTIELNGSGNATVVAWELSDNSSDDCTSASALVFSLNNLTFDCSNIGSQTVELTVADVAGNNSKCTSNLTITENTPPTALCKSQTVLLDANGNASVNIGEINDGSFDNCTSSSDLIFELNQTQFDCSNVAGAATIELTVTDGQGNKSSCFSTITVSENVPPVAVCNPQTIELDMNGNGNLTAADFGAGSSDNCTPISNLRMSINRLNFGCFDVGAFPITLTVNDDAGNVSSCTADVTVMETSPPTALCKNISTQLNTAGIVEISANELNSGSWDNCSPSVALTASIDQTVFDCSNVGTSMITLTITDQSGNISTCDAEVNISENTPPTAVCKDFTVVLDSNGLAEITAAEINNGSFDNCPAGMNINIDRTDFDCSAIGDQTVTLTATDASGNEATCFSTVKITDTTPPNAACKDATIMLDINGNGQLSVTDIENGSTDNCSANLNFSIQKTDFTCDEAGTNQIELTATDASGNASTCIAFVQVLESELPTAICANLVIELDAQGIAQIEADSLDGGSFDNCTPSFALTKTLNFDTLTCNNLGLTLVDLTIEDASGNSQVCQSEITVLDVTTPVTICNNFTVELDSLGMASIIFENVGVGSFDNCSPSFALNFSLSKTDFTEDDLGDVSVDLTVVDESGNVGGCTATITVKRGTSSIDDLKNASFDFEIFPNPANERATIRFAGQAEKLHIEAIRIFNNLGQQVSSFSTEKINESSFEIDLKKFSSGIYHVFVFDENRRVGVRKLVVE